MDEERARELLDNLGVVRPDGMLGGTGKVYWPARYHLNLPTRPNEADLDGFFSAVELEANRMVDNLSGMRRGWAAVSNRRGSSWACGAFVEFKV